MDENLFHIQCLTLIVEIIFLPAFPVHLQHSPSHPRIVLCGKYDIRADSFIVKYPLKKIRQHFASSQQVEEGSIEHLFTHHDVDDDCLVLLR